MNMQIEWLIQTSQQTVRGLELILLFSWTENWIIDLRLQICLCAHTLSRYTKEYRLQSLGKRKQERQKDRFGNEISIGITLSKENLSISLYPFILDNV